MQASVRAVSWIVARTGRKGLGSAVSQRLTAQRLLGLGFRSVEFPLVRRQWPCGFGSQPWFKSSPASAQAAFSEISTVSGGDERVLEAVRAEVRRLKEANVDMEVEPPEPFLLEEKPGWLGVILQRDYDQERIKVVCGLLLQAQDEGDEDGNVHNDSVMLKAPYALLINLTITITKGGSEALEISCQCHGDEYFINYVSYHEDSSKEGHDHAIHEKHLSEDLKREFLYFLFLRGFDDELVLFLYHYFDKKRNEERITNFEKVAAVFAKHAT